MEIASLKRTRLFTQVVHFQTRFLMSIFFSLVILAAVIGLFTALNRSTRSRHYYDPKDTGPWYDADDTDFQHVPPQGFQQQSFQPPYPYGTQHYYPNPYLPQNPYYPQQPYVQYPPPPYYRPQYDNNNWLGVSTGAMMGMMVMLGLVLMFWVLSDKGEITQGPAKNSDSYSEPTNPTHSPILKKDVYILWLRECRSKEDAYLIRKELRHVLNDEGISLLHMGATIDLCIYTKSKGDAESLLSFWQQYRSGETQTYDLEPKVINLRDWCSRLTLDPDATEIFCGEK